MKYYSESKDKWIDVDDMADVYVRNAFKKLLKQDSDRVYSDKKIIKAVKALNEAVMYL